MRRIATLALGLTLALSAATAVAGVASARPIAPERASTPAPTRAVGCSQHNALPFVPTSVSLSGVGGASVLGAPRVKGLPGTPPLTTAGKVQMAWDKPGVRPGFRHGHVLMNAHAWPDGSALGNKLVAGLKVGAVIRVSGSHHKVQCYRVVQVTVQAPTKSLVNLYYGSDKSRPRLAIITCAGVRRGPGDWSKRAVWLAKPIA